MKSWLNNISVICPHVVYLCHTLLYSGNYILFQFSLLFLHIFILFTLLSKYMTKVGKINDLAQNTEETAYGVLIPFYFLHWIKSKIFSSLLTQTILWFCDNSVCINHKDYNFNQRWTGLTNAFFPQLPPPIHLLGRRTKVEAT